MARYYVRTDSSGVYQAWDDTNQTVVFTGTFPVVARKVDELNAQTQNQQQPDTQNTDPQSNDENDKKSSTPSGNSNRPKTQSEQKTNSTSTEFEGKRTWNPLGDFSSYTYRISLYAMSPDAYNSYKETGYWNKSELYLVCQSGGINNDPAQDAQRASGFDLDYYIDDLSVTSYINGKEIGMSTTSINFHFKIVEPYGATLPTKLIQAQNELQQNSAVAREVNNLSEALWGYFLISVRFYGYDENGAVVSAEKYNNGGFSVNLDADATFERSFPIQLTHFKFRFEGKGQVYDIKGCTVDELEGFGTKRGFISYNKTASGRTVGEVLGGQGITTDGIFDQLNKEQQDKVNDGIQSIADEYEIVFESNSKIESALLVDPDINKGRVPMTQVDSPGASNVRQSASASSASMETSRNITINSGTAIVQALDQIITQSSYVSDALTILNSEEAQGAQEGDPLTEANAKPKTLQWFVIVPVTKVIGFDKKRNDYAFKITYVIKSYDVPYVRSTSIKFVPKYPGPHKIYNYFYTGKNSEVISYEQDYNLLYFLYATESAEEEIEKNEVKGVKVAPKPANNADSTGKAAGSFEGPNNIKTFLYSENDLLRARITILGDPDFLMPSTFGTIGQIMEKWYGEDYSINPNTGQVFIELIFNQVEDYSHSDGLMTPNGNIDYMNFSNTKNNDLGTTGIEEMIKGTVFMIWGVESRFSKGRFTQEFKVSLPNFNDMAISDSPTPAATASGPGGRESNGGPATVVDSSKPSPNRTAETAQRTGVNLSTSAGAGRGIIGGPSANQANQIKYAPASQYKITGRGQTADDDQLTVEGPNFKRKYEPVRGYNHDLERYYADTQNQSRRYGGLTGREAYNPANDPRRVDR